MTGAASSRTHQDGGAKHLGIVRVLEREIRAGELAHGQQLPGESALAARFSVSRNTVRAALALLAGSGLIRTHSGKGSYVIYDGEPLNVRLGWAHARPEHQPHLQVQVLRQEQLQDAALAADLGTPFQHFLAVDRLRTVVGGPAISYECSRLPVNEALSSQLEAGAAAGSLTRLLVNAGLRAATGEQWVEVRALDPAQAAIMKRRAGEVFLWSRCVTRTRDGQLVENVESLLDPAYFRIQFQFSPDGD